MTKTRLVIVALSSLALAFPTFGKHYKNKYPVPSSEVWPAVKDTLSHADNYKVLASDDAEMTADYNVQHSVHANIAGTVLQPRITSLCVRRRPYVRWTSCRTSADGSTTIRVTSRSAWMSHWPS
jgi:hypothetical protein